MGERRKLGSWKEIADQLGCTVRTAQRWEKDDHLPVYRVSGERGHRVFAYTDELAAWLHNTRSAAPPDLPEMEGRTASSRASPPPSPTDSTLPPDPLLAGEDASPALLRPPAPEWASSVAAEIFWNSRNGYPVDDGSPPFQTGGGVPAAVPAARQRHDSASLRRRLRVALWLAIPALALAAAMVWFQRDVLWPPEPLLSVRAQGRTLTGLDDLGRELWRKEFPQPLDTTAGYFMSPLSQTTQVVDLDRDGRLEVLAATGGDRGDHPVPWVLYCLDSRGSIRWQYQPGKAMTFGNQRCDENWQLFFDTPDLDGDGRQEILVVSHNHRLFPAKVALLDPQGRNRGEFLNSGWVEFINYADLDDDGRMEILAGGCHNGYRRPCLFVLDVRRIRGSSPQPDHPGYSCPDHPPGGAKQYLLFPRDPVMSRLAPIGTIHSITVTSGNIIAHAPSGIESPPLSGSMDYILRNDLSLERADVSSAYELLYQHLFSSGVLTEPFSPAVAGTLDPILYWNGTEFTPQPAVNRHWKGQ